MLLPSLSELTDSQLLSRIKLLHETENQAIADVVLHLHEIDTRGIYRDAGYSSLFIYCREALGYSEGAAFRRVRAARCLNDSPGTYELLRSGKVSLCALSEVSPVMTKENAPQILELAQGASKQEAQRIAVRYGAVEKPKKGIIRAKKVVKSETVIFEGVTSPAKYPEQPVEERFSFSFEGKKEVKDLYEEAKVLMGGHVGMEEVFEAALKEYVAKRRKEVRPRKTSPACSVENIIFARRL